MKPFVFSGHLGDAFIVLQKLYEIHIANNNQKIDIYHVRDLNSSLDSIIQSLFSGLKFVTYYPLTPSHDPESFLIDLACTHTGAYILILEVL